MLHVEGEVEAAFRTVSFVADRVDDDDLLVALAQRGASDESIAEIFTTVRCSRRQQISQLTCFASS